LPRPEIVRESYLADSDRIATILDGQTLPAELVGSYGAIGLAGDFFSTQLTRQTDRQRVIECSGLEGFGSAYSGRAHNKSTELVDRA